MCQVSECNYCFKQGPGIDPICPRIGVTKFALLQCFTHIHAKIRAKSAEKNWPLLIISQNYPILGSGPELGILKVLLLAFLLCCHCVLIRFAYMNGVDLLHLFILFIQLQVHQVRTWGKSRPMNEAKIIGIIVFLLRVHQSKDPMFPCIWYSCKFIVYWNLNAS